MSRPPETCCKPLAEAVAHDMPCLCIIFSSPEVLKAFNLNLQEAMMLSTGCGISSDQTVCSPAGPSAAPSVNSGALPFKVKWIGVVFVMALPFFY
ncbi:hypothetical protein J5N97_018996 [Dioscorea zingiberensis]|uniref:Bifunctional inhibitor/plant lipid transfer protein/seed storage helical domain-containing protein n=1 Tax=Dioscorea zingiberensis TaxID=325984 RepID=A0A9D5CE62_9LILI|nr:hypothetical protein J5N97_018996 [Dioscorea zingiberensis]